MHRSEGNRTLTRRECPPVTRTDGWAHSRASVARLSVWRCPADKEEQATDPQSRKSTGLAQKSGDLGSRLTELGQVIPTRGCGLPSQMQRVYFNLTSLFHPPGILPSPNVLHLAFISR